MPGQSEVGAERLLLALARGGNVQCLLGERGIAAFDIYCAIVRAGWFGPDLIAGRVPRSTGHRSVR
jgi:hypothetical protein